MLPGIQPDLQEAIDLGISLFAGEAEGRLDDLLRDAANGTMQPVYNFLADLPGIESAPAPFLLRKHVSRTIGNYSTFDAGRGCPYQCSFCTIINVQGRKSRRRSADDVEQIIRQNWAEGIHRFFITDDNLARNKDWESIFDRLIELRERDGIKVSLMIQVDTLCHKIPNFIEKAGRAGVRRVFIGLESINPETLTAAKKRQNKITEYRKLLLAWRAAGVFTYAGYILGFPSDTPESIHRDLEIIQRELPIDMLEFFCLTPLPGSEDHQILYRKGIWMDPDMNKYDTEHAVTAHPKMSKDEWTDVYMSAWRTYYSPAHMRTIMRRAAASGISLGSLAGTLLHFAKFAELEKVHPLQGGVFRLKYRRDRRPGLPIEPVWVFYPRYAFDVVHKLGAYGRTFASLMKFRRALKRNPEARGYMDEALSPVTEDETSSMSLFTQSEATRTAVHREQEIKRLTSAPAT
jgi:hypothetical protein